MTTRLISSAGAAECPQVIEDRVDDIDSGQMLRSANGLFQAIGEIWLVAARMCSEQAVGAQQQNVTAPHQGPLVNLVSLFEAQYALAPAPIHHALGRKRTKGWKQVTLLAVHFP